MAERILNSAGAPGITRSQSLLTFHREAVRLNSDVLRHYSLEAIQHPIRARMCGFGDKVGHDCPLRPLSYLLNMILPLGSSATGARSSR